MADPLSVAGLAAGVVSLGIQVSQGITTYIDALNCRDQDIVSVRQRNDSLRKTLRIVETSHSQLEGDHQVATTAIRECLDSCNRELSLLENLVIDLTTCDHFSAGLIDKVKNKSKRLLYPFSRPKLEQLETRLRNANMALQLALQILGLSVSHLGTEKLITLEATFPTLSTGVRNVQSEVSALSLPLQGIHGSMSGFEARLDKMEGLLQQLLVQRPATNGIPREITFEVATGRLLAKPGVLRDICDAAETVTRTSGIGPTMNHRATRFKDTDFIYEESSSCLCRHRQRPQTKKVVCGPLIFSSEAAIEQHLPRCPARQVMIGTNRSHRVGLAYTGLQRLLNIVIQLSFEMSWGAGAWSLGPIFTYYPRVDSSTAPAFRVLSLLSHSPLGRELGEKVTVLAMSTILRLFRAKKASPRDVDADNRSLVYHLAACMTMVPIPFVLQVSNQTRPTALLELLKCLLDKEAPANEYDTHGNTPLSRLFTSTMYSKVTDPLFGNAANLILQSDAEDNLACLSNPNPAAYSTIVDRSGRQVDANGNAVIFYFLAYSTRIAQAYGCNPLGVAILSNNLAQVEQLSRNHPAGLAERDLFGHMPLHLAADKPSCLQLLVKAVDAELLNQEDRPNKFGMNALETAVYLSGLRCREGRSGRMCEGCSCDDCAVILLEADCSVPVSGCLQNVLSHASRRCVVQYISGMRDRRDRLKQLALDNLPITELNQLGLMSTSVLNSAALPVFQFLEDCGVPIPGALTPSRNEPLSVYQALCLPSDAQLFFDVGFDDTDSWCKAEGAELEDIPNLIQGLPYLHWLATHGGASFRHLDSSATPREIYVANYTFWRIGGDLNHWLGSCISNKILWDTPFRGQGFTYQDEFPSLEDRIVWLREVNGAVLPAEIADNCRCKCSPGGCTPLISLLKGVPGLKDQIFGYKRKCSLERTSRVLESTESLEDDSAVGDQDSSEGSVAWDTESSKDESWCLRGSLSEVAREFARYLELCGGDLDAGHHTAALRYMTFTALDLPHSCCDPHGAYWEYDDGTSEQMAEVEEEHAYKLELLDDLLGDFEKQIAEALQKSIPGADDVVHFWTRTWVYRMRDVINHLQGADLTEDERRGAEEIGVVWDKPKPPPSRITDNPHPTDRLEHWIYELEKIESQC